MATLNICFLRQTNNNKIHVEKVQNVAARASESAIDARPIKIKENHSKNKEKKKEINFNMTQQVSQAEISKI